MGISAVPRLEIEAPAELAAARKRLESFDTMRLQGVMQLIGLTDPGKPIRVVLADERSAMARQVPSSTAGFAVSDESLIVLFPSRSPAYPHDTLEDVLHHEVAHVLMARAARGAPLPRWFQEGVAMTAERLWTFEDRARLIFELMPASRTPLGEVNAMFEGDERSRARAYTIAGAFVRDLVTQYGTELPADILREVAAGASFDWAFLHSTGRSAAAAEVEFWDRHRFWTTIGPFLTTPTALWMMVTLIALYAIVRRRQQRAALRMHGDDEEGGEPEEEQDV